MKTLTQLLIGMIGLSAFISLPVVAQSNQIHNSSRGNPQQTAQSDPDSRNQPAQDGKTPNSSDATPATKNIVEEAASSKQFQTLIKVIKAAGLEETLAAKGPYTIFAPTDQAFAGLPEGSLEQLLQPENKDLLRHLLNYHVVLGSVTKGQLKNGQIKTLSGDPVTVEVSKEGTVTVNNAKVTQADIQVSNGIIHVVDQVIIPQGSD
jgi:uncharacterized surface protein with fasciclin (FAS1) repeats